jgi:hypothetical protein
MTADMYLLDSQLSSQCSSDKKGCKAVIKLARQRLSALEVFKKSYGIQEDDPQSRFDGPAQVDNAEAMGLPTGMYDGVTVPAPSLAAMPYQIGAAVF